MATELAAILPLALSLALYLTPPSPFPVLLSQTILHHSPHSSSIHFSVPSFVCFYSRV